MAGQTGTPELWRLGQQRPWLNPISKGRKEGKEGMRKDVGREDEKGKQTTNQSKSRILVTTSCLHQAKNRRAVKRHDAKLQTLRFLPQNQEIYY